LIAAVEKGGLKINHQPPTADHRLTTHTSLRRRPFTHRQAAQFVAEHGEVCPAGWTPGAPTMKADQEGSQEYFKAAAAGGAAAAASAGPSKVTPIASPAAYAALAERGARAAVVKFESPSCQKCQQIKPFVEELAAGHPGVEFFSVDTAAPALEALQSQVEVPGLPHFVLVKGGKVVDSVTGYKKKMLGEAVAALERM
jgi:thiol-disulfide isomerase/thioredoxin